jgi:hypothetical protein
MTELNFGKLGRKVMTQRSSYSTDGFKLLLQLHDYSGTNILEQKKFIIASPRRRERHG